MPFRYTGHAGVLYSQYRDALTGRPLEPAQGGEYEPEPVGGENESLPVPPADGNWEDATPPAPAAKKTKGGE